MSTLHDTDRSIVLRDLGLLAAQPDPPFDRLTRLAARSLDIPVVLVSFVSDECQVFPGAIGLPEPWASRRTTPLSHSFCQHVVATNAPLIIEDARLDPLVRDNLAIPEMGVIAYAGMPLRTSSGDTLGSFCAIDTKPHTWTAEELALLTDFADAAMAEIALRATMRAAEAARHEWQTLLDASGEAVYGLDASGRCTYINEAALAFFGYTAAECRGHNMHELVHARHTDGSPYPRHDCPIYGALLTGTPVRLIEDVFWHKDGHALPALYSTVPLIEQGIVRGAVVTIVDIGDRKRAEEWQQFLAKTSAELANSLDYNATLHTLTMLLVPQLADWCAIDLMCEDGHLTRAAFAHADPHKEPLLAEMSERYPPATAEPSPLLRALRGRRTTLHATISAAELAALTHDADHTRLVEEIGFSSALIVPLYAHGRTLGVLSLVRGSDNFYSEQDRTQVDELAQRCAVALDNARLYQQAQDAVLLRDQFVAIASHELRTPVTSIRGYAQLLARQAQKGMLDPERVTRQTGQIITQTARLTSLISDLLDASRIQQGRLDLHPVRCDLTALAREAFAAFETAPERSARHTLMFDAAEAIVGLWDSGRLDQVLTNLLSNALKYSPQGGAVQLRVQRVGHNAEVVVSDEGVGIPVEEQKALFQPFARGTAAHGRISGTGLGLYIVRQIVEAHGGSVAVESSLHVGTTFTVTLPLAPPLR